MRGCFFIAFSYSGYYAMDKVFALYLFYCDFAPSAVVYLLNRAFALSVFQKRSPSGYIVNLHCLIGTGILLKKNNRSKKDK